jgi:hypothetical protein
MKLLVVRSLLGCGGLTVSSALRVMAAIIGRRARVVDVRDV